MHKGSTPGQTSNPGSWQDTNWMARTASAELSRKHLRLCWSQSSSSVSQRFTAFQCLGGGWQNHSNSWSQHIPYSPALKGGRWSSELPTIQVGIGLESQLHQRHLLRHVLVILVEELPVQVLEAQNWGRARNDTKYISYIWSQLAYRSCICTLNIPSFAHSPSSACSAPSQSFTNSVGPLGQLSRLTQAQATVEAAFVARCSAGADWGPCCSPGCGARWYRPDVQPLILFYFCYIVAGKLLSFAFATRWVGFQNEVRGFSALPRAAWQGQLAELKWGVGDGSRPRYPC